MNSIIAFIIVLGILIFVHEFGHFLFAKIFRVKVLKFSLGFGPKLLGCQYGETEYRISSFPLGGYVKMFGEQPGEELAPIDEGRSFSHKSVWQRFFIVLGGPAFNIFFAVLIFIGIYLVTGMPEMVETTQIGAVGENTPSQAAGIQQYDFITAINDQPVTTWEDISTMISSSNGAPISLTIRRQQEQLTIRVIPEKKDVTNIFGEKVEERFQIGITRHQELIYHPISPLEAVGAGFSQTWFYCKLTVVSIVKLAQRVIPASEIGGPILIAQVAGQKMQDGWVDLLIFTGLISINLGILNLLPIPVLDGGHLALYLIEALRGKPMNVKAQEIMQQIGLVLLVSLMLFAFYNDIFRATMK